MNIEECIKENLATALVAINKGVNALSKMTPEEVISHQKYIKDFLSTLIEYYSTLDDLKYKIEDISLIKKRDI
jgi:hypothetical protein